MPDSEIIELAHSLRSPSGWDKWGNCAGSVNAEQPFPPQKPSEYAAEGDVFHDLMAQCLTHGMDAEDFLGQEWTAQGFRFVISRDMVKFGQPGLDWIREQPGELYVEQEVSLDAWLPGEKGTLDVGIVAPDLITVKDWKYGRGTPVWPENNGQIMLYGLGFWSEIAKHKTDATRFRFVIEQPRLPGAGGTWECDLETLLRFGEHAAERHQMTFDPNAKRTPSEKACRWCRAKWPKGRLPGCADYEAFNLELMALAFDDLDADPETPPTLPKVRGLTAERRAYLARHSSMFSKFMDQVYADTLDEALAGNPTPGMKAVLGRKGSRDWTDTEAATALLERSLGKTKAYNKKLKSPSQAEAEMGTRNWKKAEKLIVQSEAKPTLVPEQDKRPAVDIVEDLFDDLDAPKSELDNLI